MAEHVPQASEPRHGPQWTFYPLHPSRRTADTTETLFPRFSQLTPEIRRRIWCYACPELEAPALVLSFAIEPENEELPDQSNLILWASPDLLSQARELNKLLEINRETRALVRETFPDFIDFKHHNVCDEQREGVDNIPPVASGRCYFRKETDIVWLELGCKFSSIRFSLDHGDFRLDDGVKEARNVGFLLSGGRSTLYDPIARVQAVDLLQQFPKLENFYYGISTEKLYFKYCYAPWCFQVDCHEYGMTYSHSSNNGDEVWRDAIWRWPTMDSVGRGGIPRIISKNVRPIEETAQRLGWTCIPIFEFDGDTTYCRYLHDAESGQHALVYPEGSDMSEDEYDHELPGYRYERPVTPDESKVMVCGARPNPLPFELRDWGTIDPNIGYTHSEKESVTKETSEQTFHRFNHLPTELRYRIWELYCTDLTAPGRVYEFRIANLSIVGNRNPHPKPSGYRVYDTENLKYCGCEARKVLAVNQESRNLALKAFPDTLDFRVTPYDEVSTWSEISKHRIASLRFRKETDVILLRETPEWVWDQDGSAISGPDSAYELPNFGHVVQNLAICQTPEAIFWNDRFDDIKQLMRHFPNLVNYYYLVPSYVADSRYMTWAVAPETTRHLFKHAESPEPGDYAPERELFCWVTQDALPKIRIPRRIGDMANRLKPLAEEKGVNLLPMTHFYGRRDLNLYVAVVEEEERARLRAERDEPEEPESDVDGTNDNHTIPLETVIGAVMDGTIPGGLDALSALLGNAGIDPHAWDEAYGAFQQEDDWEDVDSEEDYEDYYDDE